MIDIPVWEKSLLTVEEAAAYFHIGENKLRRLIANQCCEKHIVWNGNRPMIKRKLFEEWLYDQKDI